MLLLKPSTFSSQNTDTLNHEHMQRERERERERGGERERERESIYLWAPENDMIRIGTEQQFADCV